MSSNNSTAPLSAADHFEIYSMPFSIGQIILSLLGIFGNANIIIATIRAKNLKYKCNYLIFISAVFDLYTCVAFLQIDAYLVLNESIVPNNVCFQRIGHGIFTMNIGEYLVLSIGLDRLLAIKFAAR
jgi:hypothetical protein